MTIAPMVPAARAAARPVSAAPDVRAGHMAERAEAAARAAAAWAEYARAIVGTAFVPQSLYIYDEQHNLDIDASVAQITAALMTGDELGLDPMASLRSIDVIPPGSGNPALRAAALRGLLQHRGHEIWIVESNDTRAIVEGVRRGSNVTQRSTWTMDRAAKMQIRGFRDPRGAWQRMPQNQLVARATAECARWIAADALLGLPYIVEEMADLPEGEASSPSPPEGEAGQAPTAAAPPRRRAARASAATPRAARPKSPPTRGQEPPGEPASGPPSNDAPPEPGAATGRQEPPPEPEGEAEPERPPAPGMSAATRAALWATLRRIGVTDGAAARVLCGQTLRPPRELKTSNEITDAEGKELIAEFKRREARQAAAEQNDEPPIEEPPDDE